LASRLKDLGDARQGRMPAHAAVFTSALKAFVSPARRKLLERRDCHPFRSGMV